MARSHLSEIPPSPRGVLQEESSKSENERYELIPLQAWMSSDHQVDEFVPSASDETPKDTDHDPTPNHGAIESRRIRGIVLCAAAVALTLLAHLILLVIYAKRSLAQGYGWGSSWSITQDGTCEEINKTATGLHVLVNIIVLTLTATSSYCCQVLAAPSREIIDKVHSQRVWISIGASSFTNIWYAPFWRKILWIMILGTSLPVQMVYNSFLYVSYTANDFGIVTAPSELTSPNANLTDLGGYASWLESDTGVNITGLHAEIMSGEFEKMSLASCREAYESPYQTGRSTLVLLAPYEGIVESWSCRLWLNSSGVHTILNNDYNNSESRPCQLSKADPENNFIVDWEFEGIPINECYSKAVTPTCQLGCSLPLGLLVLCCIAIKLICILITACERRTEVFLTVGDAIASFLRRTDLYTSNNCLMERENANHSRSAYSISPEFAFHDCSWVSTLSRAGKFRLGALSPPQPRKIREPRQFWFKALPRRLLGFLVAFKSFVIAAAVCIIAYDRIRLSDGTELNTEGMGSIQRTVTSWYHTQFHPSESLKFIAIILAVNTPQAFISIMYAIFNNVLTRMLLAAEYNDYGVERKPLRVSFPVGEQRSTYFLSVPYRYSVPFLAISVLAHWLASEALSYIRITPRDVQGQLRIENGLHGVGVSSIGLIIMVIPWIITVIAIITLMLRKFKSASMPIASNCSAAISAACHPPENDVDAYKKSVKWGEANIEIPGVHRFQVPGLPEIVTRYRRCTFTSEEVKEPSSEFLYY